MRWSRLTKIFLIVIVLVFLSFPFLVLQSFIDILLSSALSIWGRINVFTVSYFVFVGIMLLYIFYKLYHPLRSLEEAFTKEINPIVRTFATYAVPTLVYFRYFSNFNFQTTGLIVFISFIIRWGMEWLYLRELKKQAK